MRDHMMGWAIPAEPLGPAIRPLQSASKAQNEASLKEFAVLSFETGDHMLPGMKQSDFPKEYDTAVAIEDRSMGAYEKAMREMLIYGFSKPVAFGYDAGAPEGDRTVFAEPYRWDEKEVELRREWLTGDWGVGIPTKYEEDQRKKNKTASGLQMLMEAARKKYRW